VSSYILGQEEPKGQSTPEGAVCIPKKEAEMKKKSEKKNKK